VNVNAMEFRDSTATGQIYKCLFNNFCRRPLLLFVFSCSIFSSLSLPSSSVSFFAAARKAQDYLDYVKPDSSLRHAEAASLVLYTHEFNIKPSFFEVLNKFLRVNKNRKDLIPFKKYLWTLNVALQKCPVYEGY
jgi:hypothetical protein